MENKRDDKKSVGLERVKKWLYAKGLEERGAGCVLCGSCYGHGPANPMEDEPGFKTKCPPYEFYRFQRFTPKSRWLMSQRVFHGLEPITPELKEVIYTCTTCLMCQEICGVRNDGYGPWDITVAMREEMVEKEGPLEAHRPILQSLREHNRPWGQSPQPGEWARDLGLKKISEEGATTLLFAGCSADQPSGKPGAVALARILKRAGENFGILGEEESCCGLYAKDLGFRREYNRLEEENLQRIKSYGIKRVVTACGSCLRIWKDYSKQGLGGVEVLHATEYIDRLLREGRLKFRDTLKTRVTYHDPCHLGRGCGVYEPPRSALRAIPGVELVEMPRNRRWAWCCGGGGGVPEAYPDLAKWSAEDRLNEARSTGARLVLTASSLCCRSFAESGQQQPRVQDILEFIFQALP
jgi:Fe-S oxidoreductase